MKGINRELALYLARTPLSSVGSEPLANLSRQFLSAAMPALDSEETRDPSSFAAHLVCYFRVRQLHEPLQVSSLDA